MALVELDLEKLDLPDEGTYLGRLVDIRVTDTSVRFIFQLDGAGRLSSSYNFNHPIGLATLKRTLKNLGATGKIVANTPEELRNNLLWLVNTEVEAQVKHRVDKSGITRADVTRVRKL